MGKNDVRPAGGWAGGRTGGRHIFAICANYLIFVYEIWHIFGPDALVVPFGGHFAIAYIVFS